MELGKIYKPNDKMQIAFLKDGKSNTQVELIYNEARESIETSNDYSLGFETESLEHIVALAKEKNLKIVSDIL